MKCRAPLILLVLGSLAAAACTSAEDPFDREAAAVVERADDDIVDTDTPVDQPDATQAGDLAEDCVLSTIEDEYGLPIEIQVCSGDDGAPVASQGSGRIGLLGDPWFGSEDSELMTTVTTLRIVKPCGPDQPNYLDTPPNVEAALADVLAAIDAVQAQCDDAEAFRLASHELFGEIEAMSQSALGKGPRTAVLARSDQQLVAQAVEHVEWLSWILAGAFKINEHRPDLWFGSAVRGHILAAAALEDIDTLILGNSQMHFGVNPEGLPVSGYNASVPGSEPSAYVELYEYFGTGAQLDPDRVVLGLSAGDFVVGTPGGCERDTGAGLEAMFELHESLYQSTPLDFESLTMDQLLARPTLRQSLGRTALAGDHNRRFSPLGAGIDFAEPDEEALAHRWLLRRVIFEAWVECPARFRDLTRFLNTADRRSDEVLVVLMPLDPALIAFAPDQAASVAEMNGRISAAVEEGGGTVLDLTNFLSSEQMIDAVHPTEQGAALVTAAVAEVLAAG